MNVVCTNLFRRSDFRIVNENDELLDDVHTGFVGMLSKPTFDIIIFKHRFSRE